jgi:hypothetical protein
MNKVSIIDRVTYAVIAFADASIIALFDALVNLSNIYSSYLKDIHCDRYSSNLYSNKFTCSYDDLLFY